MESLIYRKNFTHPQYWDKDIHFLTPESKLPKEVINYVCNHYNYKMTFSKFIKSSYMANCCDNCDKIQGNNYIYDECDGPFYIDSPESAAKLTLYKIDLKYDLALEAGFCWGSEDYLIKRFATIKKLNIQI